MLIESTEHACFLSFFRHGCQLSSYFFCKRYGQEAKHNSCHQYCNHIVPFRDRNVVGFKNTVQNQSIPGASGLQFNSFKITQRDLRLLQSNCFSAPHSLQACLKLCANPMNFSPRKISRNRLLLSRDVLNFERLAACPFVHQRRTVFTSSTRYDPSPNKPAKITKLLEDEGKKSKVEEAVEAMKDKKEKLKEKAFQMECSPEEIEPIVAVAPAPKKSLWQRFKHECVHYYNGFKLLYLEVKIAARMLWQVMNGRVLSRRERRQVSHYFNYK